MQPLSTLDWPLGHYDAHCLSDQSKALVLTRHQIALSRYLEQQRAHRRSVGPDVDLKSTLHRLLAWVAPKRRLQLHKRLAVSGPAIIRASHIRTSSKM